MESKKRRWRLRFADTLPDSAVAARRLPITDFAHNARVVADAREPAIVAAVDMTAQRRRSALLDGRHHLQLAEAQMTGVDMTMRRSEAAENLRHFERGT